MHDAIRERQFDAGEVSLHYAEGPTAGPPLVLLHGGSARWQAFEAVIPDLAAHWHLYLPDFEATAARAARLVVTGCRISTATPAPFSAAASPSQPFCSAIRWAGSSPCSWPLGAPTGYGPRSSGTRR